MKTCSRPPTCRLSVRLRQTPNFTRVNSYELPRASEKIANVPPSAEGFLTFVFGTRVISAFSAGVADELAKCRRRWSVLPGEHLLGLARVALHQVERIRFVTLRATHVDDLVVREGFPDVWGLVPAMRANANDGGHSPLQARFSRPRVEAQCNADGRSNGTVPSNATGRSGHFSAQLESSLVSPAGIGLPGREACALVDVEVEAHSVYPPLQYHADGGSNVTRTFGFRRQVAPWIADQCR